MTAPAVRYFFWGSTGTFSLRAAVEIAFESQNEFARRLLSVDITTGFSLSCSPAQEKLRVYTIVRAMRVPNF
jgi:hypothetical protein